MLNQNPPLNAKATVLCLSKYDRRSQPLFINREHGKCAVAEILHYQSFGGNLYTSILQERDISSHNEVFQSVSLSNVFVIYSILYRKEEHLWRVGCSQLRKGDKTCVIILRPVPKYLWWAPWNEVLVNHRIIDPSENALIESCGY